MKNISHQSPIKKFVFLIFMIFGFFSIWAKTGSTEPRLTQNMPNIKDSKCQKLPGKTLTDCILQQDIIAYIGISEEWYDRICKQHSIVNTEVINPTKLERWTVSRCGKLIPYIITFTLSPSGGTDFTIFVEPK
jgi:hypothetical protein